LGFKVYYLNYAWAQDVSVEDGDNTTTTVPGVATILRDLMTSQRGSQTPSLAQYRGMGEQSLRNQGLERQQQIQNGTFQNGTLGAQGANASQPSAATVQQAWNNRPGGVQGSSIDAQLDSLNAAAAMASDARVEADPRLNAVIVRDAPARLPYYDQLIKALDVEPMELEIEATIIDLSSTKLRQLGVNWNLASDRYSFLFGNGTSSDNSLTNTLSNSLSTLTNSLAGVPMVRNITPTGNGGFLSLVLGSGNNFAARINALQDEGVARIVTSPQVMTLSNVEAVFDNNQSFYVRVAGRQEVDLFKVSAGTTLRIMPHVFKEGSDVRIKLLVQVDDGSIDSANEVDSIPEVDRSSINTQALLLAGESLLIGGMVTDDKENDVTKVPLLGDIPVLGNLFKYRSDTDNRVERLFLISPRLIPARRTITNPAPVGPQRPGGAVEPPPMPKFSPPPWDHGNETPKPAADKSPDKPVDKSPDKPAASNVSIRGDMPGRATVYN
jgi:type III secretion protein C